MRKTLLLAAIYFGVSLCFADEVVVNGAPPTAGLTPSDVSSIVSTNLGNVSGTLTPDYSASSWQAASLTNSTTLAVPTNGTAGARLELWFTASGADRSLTVTNSIKIPSDSAFTGAKILTSNQTYIVILRSPNGTNWWLQTLVGGY
jgi:hypothetical protein